jgi:hypothetical protein
MTDARREAVHLSFRHRLLDVVTTFTIDIDIITTCTQATSMDMPLNTVIEILLVREATSRPSSTIHRPDVLPLEATNDQQSRPQCILRHAKTVVLEPTFSLIVGQQALYVMQLDKSIWNYTRIITETIRQDWLAPEIQYCLRSSIVDLDIAVFRGKWP